MKSIILSWLVVVSAVLEEQPYCAVRYKRLCQEKGRHVACHFSDPGPGASCVNYTAIKFNNEMKNFILLYVNRRRQRIASGNERVRGGLHLPKPELMMLVEWDRELAFLAQRLADQCHFVHDDCRATVRYPYAGQTVGEVRWRRTGAGEAVEKGARRAIRRVLDAWWGEKRRASPQQLTTPFRMAARGAVWGHFSQLCVWGLQAMGCGAVHHGVSHPRLLLVCDFSHTNMLGQRTLTPGPLAPCPIHTMRRPRTQFPLLCAPVRQPVVIEEPEEEELYDEDEEDPGLTVGMGDAPTPSAGYSRSTSERTTTDAHTSVLVFREDRVKTKGVLIEKLDRELEVRNKAEDKSFVTEDRLVLEWRTRKPNFGLWRESQENFEEVISLQRQTTTRQSDRHAMGYYRPTSVIPPQENVPRHRWKQTRDRPLRPGAHALLITQPVMYSKRQTQLVSLMLDKEDVDQLFRDTGFKSSWKKDRN